MSTLEEIARMKAGPELNALVEKHVFGHDTEMRWCVREPEGYWNETQSLYGDEGALLDGWRGCDLQNYAQNNAAYKMLPCYKFSPVEGDEYFYWEVVPDYSGDIRAAWRVVEKEGFLVGVNHAAENDNAKWVAETYYGAVYDLTAEVAICKLALSKYAEKK